MTIQKFREDLRAHEAVSNFQPQSARLMKFLERSIFRWSSVQQYVQVVDSVFISLSVWKGGPQEIVCVHIGAILATILVLGGIAN